MTQSNKIKAVIRKIVREEVAMAIQEVVTELKQPSLSSNKPTKQVKNKKIVEKKKYTTNSVLNEMLNETANDDYPTMGGGTYDSSRAGEIVSSQYGDLMNGDVKPSPESNVNLIVGDEAPDNIKNLFDKDYSGILKKSIEKNKGKR